MISNSIPEFLETELGESIGSRTGSIATFKELGPPDLVHITKVSPKATSEHGTYHYVTGVDVFGSAAVAAYLNTLTFSLGETQLWFGRHPQWKVREGVYCCYNPFSRVDVRVSVKIPGSVDAYIVDNRGEKRSSTDADTVWAETSLGAMVRALLYADDEYYYVSGCRKMDPLMDEDSIDRFLGYFEQLFFSGPQLGCAAEYQVPTLVANLLVDAFLKFLDITGKYDQGLKVLEKLAESEPEISSLVAKVLLMKRQEIDAVKLLNTAVLSSPRDPYLLSEQADFCQKKNRLDLALDCAVRSVNAAPSEYFTWAKLAEIYIKRGDYEQALLAINSCPMFTLHDLDTHRMPPPSKVHLPLPTDGVLEEVWKVDLKSDQDTADPGLLKLGGPGLRATYSKAYELLTSIVAKIGWNQLLKYRSLVFVMEGDYLEDAKRRSSKVDNASINGVSSKTENGDGEDGDEASGEPNGVGAVNGEKPKVEGDTITKTPSAALADDNNLPRNEIKNKRLCERWLDSLFMVLFEDLRAYTVWRAEFVHHESKQIPYHKSALEWEILGMVAHRLHNTEEAIDAFKRSLDLKFSYRVLWKLLDYFVEKDDSISALDAIVKLFAWNHRWYSEFSPKLYKALGKLVSIEGVTKVRSSIEAQYRSEGIVELVEEKLKVLEKLNIPGTDN